MSGLGFTPCKHGRHGEPCVYCELERDGQKLPAALDIQDENELALRRVLRILLTDAQGVWDRGGMKQKWQGRFHAFLAWYLARRLYGVHGITINIVI